MKRTFFLRSQKLSKCCNLWAQKLQDFRNLWAQKLQEYCNFWNPTSGPRNCQNAAISGPRNCKNIAISGSRNCRYAAIWFLVPEIAVMLNTSTPPKICDFQNSVRIGSNGKNLSANSKNVCYMSFLIYNIIKWHRMTPDDI